MQHLAGLVAFLVHELIANLLKPREAVLDNFVKISPASVLGAFESVGTAGDQQTLQASENRRCVIGVQQLESDIHEAGPFPREIKVEHALD